MAVLAMSHEELARFDTLMRFHAFARNEVEQRYQPVCDLFRLSILYQRPGNATSVFSGKRLGSHRAANRAGNAR